MKTILAFFLLTISTRAISQEKESFYVFNAEWKGTTIDSALYILHVHQMNDTCWQWDFYNFVGPLLKTEQYRDKDGTELHGVCHHYDENGLLDSTSVFRGGRKNGDFFKIDADGFKYKIKYVYRNDSLLEVVDLVKPGKENVTKYEDEKESEYPGGVAKWTRYLNKNLKYPGRAVNANIEGEVKVGFIVDFEGNVNEAFIARSLEYSLDEESLKIVRGSGKWNPAFQNGKNVKSYKIQPINFRLK